MLGMIQISLTILDDRQGILQVKIKREMWIAASQQCSLIIKPSLWDLMALNPINILD